MTRTHHRRKEKKNNSKNKVADTFVGIVANDITSFHHAVLKPVAYVPLPSKSGKYTGVLTSQLHKVRVQLSNAADTTLYRHVVANKRNHNREIHQLLQALAVQCAFNDHNHHRNDEKPIYFIDDTAGHESRPLPKQSSSIDYHLELLSSMQIMDPPELATRDMKLMVGDQLIACKLSVLKRGTISKHHTVSTCGSKQTQSQP